MDFNNFIRAWRIHVEMQNYGSEKILLSILLWNLVKEIVHAVALEKWEIVPLFSAQYSVHQMHGD